MKKCQTLRSLGEEIDRTREIHRIEVVGALDDDRPAVGMAGEPHHLGMAALTEYHHLAAAGLHLGIGRRHGTLQPRHHGTGSVYHLDSETGRLLIRGRGFPVGPDEHPSAGQSLKFLMPDRAEAHRFQTLHFKAVVHDIAQAGHPAAPGERPLGLRYGIDHAEAEPRPAVYLYMYFSLCHNTNPARRSGLSVIYRVSSLPVSVLSTPSAGRASCRRC